jgi:hypothetical protein
MEEKMKRIFLITFLGILCFLSWGNNAWGVSEAGVLFLRLPAGARAAGMGETFVAISDDATATHWNPAGLGRYPLSSQWIEYHPGGEAEIISIALMENDLPEKNYKKYDIWVATSTDLFYWNGSQWKNYQIYYTSEKETLGDLLKKLFPDAEEKRINEMAFQVASENNSISKDSLEKFREKIDQILVEEYPSKEELADHFHAFLQAWDSCLVNQYNLRKLVNDFENSIQDGELSSQELDNISMILETGITKNLEPEIRIPYRIIFPDTITCIASQDKDLWVGTIKGLFRYDGKVWTRHGMNNGMFSELITLLTIGPDGTVWAGTDVGIAKFDGKKWLFITPSSISDFHITGVVVKENNDIWITSRSELVHYNGMNWRPYENYKVKVGDNLEKIARSFLGTESTLEIEKAVENIKKYNSISDTLITDQEIKLPYSLAIKGKPTVMAVDEKGGLWLGSTKGIKRYVDKRWTIFGYRLYNAVEGDSVQEVAGKLLRTKDQKRIARFSADIMDYNDLDTNQLESGQKIYIYHNAAGSEILSISPGGDEVFVGTEFGTLRFDGKNWSRYYHAGLERAKTKIIWQKDREVWFAAPDRIVVYAHARRELTFMHANLLPELASDLYYEYLSYVHYLKGWGTVGGNLTFLSYGEIVQTTESPVPVGTFMAYEGALTLSYGTKINRNLAVGLSGKVIFSHLSEMGAGAEKGEGTGTSFALDAGLIYQTPFKRLILGTALTNLGPNISYIDAPQSDPLPRNIALGVAYKIFDSPYNRLTVTGELNKQLVGLKESFEIEFREAIRNVGLEYWYGTFVALRAGYIYDKEGDIRAPTFGAGLQYNIFRFDFAYIPASEKHVLGNTMRFSMTGRF